MRPKLLAIKVSGCHQVPVILRASSRGRSLTHLPISRHGDDDLAARVPLLHVRRPSTVSARGQVRSTTGVSFPSWMSPVTASSSSWFCRDGSGRSRCETNALATTARRMPATGPNTWPGEPPPLSTRVPFGVSAPRSRVSGRLLTLSRITSYRADPPVKSSGRVVDDVRGADRAHQLDVARAAHPGDLGAQRRRDLDGVRAHPAAGPVDEHPLTGRHLAHVADPAQGRRRRYGDRGRLLEGKARRLGHHHVRRGARVLRERAPAEAEHLLADPQPAHVRADRLHHTRRVDPGHPGLRLGQPHAHQPRDERVSPQDMPVGRVERGGVHPNQHVIGPGLGPASIGQLQGVRRAEPVLDDSFHRVLPLIVTPRRGDRY